MYSDTNGAFSFTATTPDILPGKNKPFSQTLACFVPAVNDSLATVAKKADGSLAIYSNAFDLVKTGDRYINPLLTSDVNLGDFPIWPAKNFVLNSDIPVQFKIYYVEEESSRGNNLFKTAHTLSNAMPLDYNTIITLTDNSGNKYFAPTKRYNRDAGCSPSVLTFTDSIFTWD
jgi:hypothetical protein